MTVKKLSTTYLDKRRIIKTVKVLDYIEESLPLIGALIRNGIFGE